MRDDERVKVFHGGASRRFDHTLLGVALFERSDLADKIEISVAQAWPFARHNALRLVSSSVISRGKISLTSENLLSPRHCFRVGKITDLLSCDLRISYSVRTSSNIGTRQESQVASHKVFSLFLHLLLFLFLLQLDFEQLFN